MPEGDEVVDLTLGGLRRVAIQAGASVNQYQAMRDLEYVKAMALIQIAQELNESKHLLANIANSLKEWDYDFNVKIVNWPGSKGK